MLWMIEKKNTGQDLLGGCSLVYHSDKGYLDL